jgi:phosphoglycolate phosphatase
VIQQKGVTQSILSAYKQSTLDELVAYFELASFFIKVNGLDHHYASSKEDIGKRWMEALHYGPHEVLFVGDTVHDFEVASAIGADCVLIPNGHQPLHKLEATGSLVLENIEDILNLNFCEKAKQ